MELPQALTEKILSFPETHMGVQTIALVLEDGRVIEPVDVAWGRRIVKVAGKEHFDVAADEIVDVLDRS